MAETTTDETELSRSEAAAYLRSIADELDAGDRAVDIPVGNKEIRLSPPDRFEAETSITERSRRLRKDTEELAIRFKWNPTGDTAESDPESETATATEPESETETETEPETNP